MLDSDNLPNIYIDANIHIIWDVSFSEGSKLYVMMLVAGDFDHAGMPDIQYKKNYKKYKTFVI